MAGREVVSQELPHRRTRLFGAAGVSLVDFRCREHGERDSPEEPNPTHSIAFVRRGVFRRRHLGRTVLADAGHVLFFNAGHPYQYSHPVPGGDDCTILTVETSAALELVARYAPRDAQDPTAPFRLGHGRLSSRLTRLHYELLAALRYGATALAVEDVLSHFSYEAVRTAYMSHAISHRAADSTAERRHHDLAEATKVFVNRQLHDIPSLASLARTLSCSPFHLSRVFHETEGVTLRRYAGRLRGHLAADALAKGTSNLTDLALRLGYTDHSHFTNAFRREWGCPPSQFRQRYRRRTSSVGWTYAGSGSAGAPSREAPVYLTNPGLRTRD